VMTLALGVVAFVPLFIHGAPAWLAWVR
jgi:hypothetical protein